MRDNLTKLASQPWFVPAVTGVLSFGAGTGLGYILWGRRETVSGASETEVFHDVDDAKLSLFEGETWNQKVERLMALEENQDCIPSSRDEIYYEDDADDIPWELEEEAELIVEEIELEDAIAAEETVEIVNVFASSNEETKWNYQVELENRTEHTPYVIHQDEFINDEMDFDQSTVTYYHGDDIMADESDVPIYDYSSLMGDLKFGHGSGDPNVVYIRNVKLGAEWEVLFHSGKFEVEVLGNDVEDAYAKQELRHSNSPRKFRDD